MKEIAEWVRSLELRAMVVYTEAAGRFQSDEPFASFLRGMAEDEALHDEVMASAIEYFSHHPVESRNIRIDPESRQRIEAPLVNLDQRIAERLLTRELLFEAMVESEYSEWNDLFVYIVNTLKQNMPEFKAIGPRIQAHKRRLEAYLEKHAEGAPYLQRLKRIPDLWQERILVVEDDDSLRELFAAILQRDGTVDTAENGRVALGMAQQTYYRLILSDIEMPEMNGIQFCEQLLTLYPGINRRFIFTSGNLNPERDAFMKRHGLIFLSKPATLNALRGAVAAVMQEPAVP